MIGVLFTVSIQSAECCRLRHQLIITSWRAARPPPKPWRAIQNAASSTLQTPELDTLKNQDALHSHFLERRVVNILALEAKIALAA